MISNLLNILKSDERLYGWNVKVTTTSSYQLFFIRQQLDMNREVVVDDYDVTIFIKEENRVRTKVGSTSFKIYSTMSDDEVKAKLDEQISLCKYTLNQGYTLPKKVNLKPVTKEKSFAGYSLKEAAFIAADALFEADKYHDGYINSSEIFVDFEEIRFFDSNGNIFLYTKESGKIEIVVTWKSKSEEVELYKFFEFDRLDSSFIQSKANELLLEARDRVMASNTPELTNYKVLLSNEYVKEFFNYFVNKTKTDYIYAHMSDYDVSYHIQKKNNKSDLLTIRLEPTIKNSTKGAPFDSDGVALKKLPIIEKGIVKTLWGSNSKSQYLNKQVHGNYQNVIVNAGTLTKDDLIDENYLEVVSLSDFSIDPITGDFGSEIRLAYLYSKGKERQIVTGGSISGNVNLSLDTLRFTNETVQHNNYIGPKKVLLDKIQVNKG